ncbi:PAB-dependent poly(A)-specific ribonuclease subunit 3 [Didymosphaeria variabile]|uniref:PAN2-PAN3 deadenylation complex subunit PAN3 n=1 Tax=Didymosphaeria variabile TaxID=1932322 RepID=A0A9W8XX24_9PLEO|nr:PAB-dependent poly(A)-specific ribonuclease subunit 3 [Didymosphaeria variabile]KAJ4360355.1 PAB-dependent poly(A)-specific ribonuclease subunit 3 [Didymosphaeria variabile]
MLRGLGDDDFAQRPPASRCQADTVGQSIDMLPGTHRSHVRAHSSPKPFANKADVLGADPLPRPSPPLAQQQQPHASASAGSDTTTSAPLSELTSSSSSRDSIPTLDPAAELRRGETTPQKQGKNTRRAKTHNKTNKWTRNGAGSSDSTGSERKTSVPQAPRHNSQSAASSPQSTRSLQRQQSHTHAALHQGRSMATTYGGPAGDSRRGVASPRPKGREAKNTFCRNVTIYGHCRYENTCPYIHDSTKLGQNENKMKRFNVDSPSFTPLQASTNGSLTPSSRGAAISPKAASAAIFTPKSQRSAASTPSLQTKEPAVEWHPQQQDFTEFVPGQTFENQMVDPNAQAQALSYDPFTASSAISAITSSGHQTSAINPYVQDPSLSGASYFGSASGFQSSPAYHLYWPVGPQPTGLLAYQRTAHDFFIPDSVREDLQKKAEISRQVASNSSIPPIEQFHSLFCLDTSPQKNQSIFGYTNWVYKAVSSKDGNMYALRRLENFRLTNETAIRSAQAWKRILNGSVVTIHEAFTTRAFGDSSLIFVTDYHPNSRTLAEEHFKQVPMQRYHGRQAATSHVPEQVLWGYLVQIASALKAIHGSGLAARLISPSKIILTSKNRIRLNACGILDVVQHETARPLPEMQADDLLQLGRLILCIANGNLSAHLNMQKSMEYITRSYTARLKECIQWLISPQTSASAPSSPTTPGTSHKDIDTFLGGIADQMATVFDSELHAQDTLTNTLARELESSRIARLLIKLNFVNERPELDASQHVPGSTGPAASSSWAETGERYYLKLFRDYVFHQVDANGHPVMNLAHVLDCLNKLDAGTEEKVMLISRDEQNVLIVSYRELKRGLESSFQDLVRAGRQSGK